MKTQTDSAPEMDDSPMSASIEAPIAALGDVKVGDMVSLRVTSIDGDTATLEPSSGDSPSSIDQAASEFNNSDSDTEE